MQNRRDATLHGTLEATRLHRELATRNKIAVYGGRVDVFAAIIEKRAELIFKQLDGLLGAYIPTPYPGILVTTERSLAIQRYTAAHELGHFYLKHRSSLDDDTILQRSAALSRNYDLNEVAADAFASEFLVPEWLVNYHAERQLWTRADLRKPATLYQFALRVGASYEATCRTLERHGILSRSSSASLMSVERKEIKQQLLGSHPLSNWLPNVWLLTKLDEGSVIYGEPNDVFIVRLNEHSGSGYIWNIDQVAAAGFRIVADEHRATGPSDEIGGEVQRILTAQSPEGVIGNLELAEKRPWDSADFFGRFSFAYDFRGRESGLPRAARERLFAA